MSESEDNIIDIKRFGKGEDHNNLRVIREVWHDGKLDYEVFSEIEIELVRKDKEENI